MTADHDTDTPDARTKRELQGRILDAAHAWRRDVTTAPACPFGEQGFDDALKGVREVVDQILGSQASAFFAKLYADAATLHDTASPNARRRIWDFVFVPFLAQDGDLSPVTGAIEATVGFADALEVAGYADPDDVVLFFPRPIRIAWLLSRGPGEVHTAFTSLVASLKGTSTAPETREAELRQAFEQSIDSAGGEGDAAGPCIRALLGLRIVHLDDDADTVPDGDAGIVIARLAETYPTLACAPPGGLVESLGQMTVMDLGQRWLIGAREAGFHLDLGHDPQPWTQRLGRVHLYEDVEAVHIVPETECGQIEPVTLSLEHWRLVRPEILAAITVYGGAPVHHQGPLVMPKTHVN